MPTDGPTAAARRHRPTLLPTSQSHVWANAAGRRIGPPFCPRLGPTAPPSPRDPPSPRVPVPPTGSPCLRPPHRPRSQTKGRRRRSSSSSSSSSRGVWGRRPGPPTILPPPPDRRGQRRSRGRRGSPWCCPWSPPHPGPLPISHVVPSNGGAARCRGGGGGKGHR